MVKFAHIADVHLGGWKQPQMQALNFQSFTKAVDICIQEKVDFVLIAGDLFDTAFPGIEILKETFAEFKKLKEANIACFIIAGSHDFSVSGKTFLDVLERAGFCTNVEKFEEKDELLYLQPTHFGNVALYGYPGRKSGLEVPQLRKVRFNDSPGMFTIFMMHTTLDKAKGTLPIDAIETDSLPKADYYALGHLHIDFQYENFVYPGPVYPNNFQELEDLRNGSFYIVDTQKENLLQKQEIKIKDIVSIKMHIKNALNATEKIIAELKTKDISDKIVLLRLVGEIEVGSNADIKYQKIEEFAQSCGAYALLKNTHALKTKETEIEIELENAQNVEEEAIQFYTEQNPSDFNALIQDLMSALSLEKQEGETSEAFNTRLLNATKNILKL